jgi:hypothetical protein
MFHRILETIFFIQAAVESMVESACEVREEAVEAARSKVKRRHKTPRPAAREHNHRHHRHETEHTFKDLPSKFFSLFRQFSRFVFVSVLGELLGKE